jgi:HEAT repeat protein
LYSDAAANAALFEALDDSSFRVRFSAAHSLIEKNPDGNIEPVVRALRHHHGKPTTGVPPLPDANELFELGLEWCQALPLTEILANAFKGESEALKIKAARILGRMQSPEAKTVLESARGDSSSRVRAAVDEALRRMTPEVS